MIDTHCHLNFKAFEKDWRAVADRAEAAGVTKMIVVGSDLENSRRAVELAQQHPALYAAVGVHPHHARAILKEIYRQSGTSHSARSAQDDSVALKSLATESISTLIKELAHLAEQPRVVAVGEIGLDHHVPKVSNYPEELLPITDELKGVQKELFEIQLKLASEMNKPVILHSRECGDEVLEIAKQWAGDNEQQIRGVFHCFGGSKKYLKRILEAGFYVGFDGDVTYVLDRMMVANEVPLNRLLTETDSPWLTPVPYRGERNEPKNVALIVQAHAKARGITVEELGRATRANAMGLFELQEN